MSTKGASTNSGTIPLPRANSVLVERTAVLPIVKEYGEYRRYLRHDFFYSCAYCTMAESEATAIRFEIDHYEPQTARPDLILEYTNLMYSCDECNSRKGDLCPPPDARTAGFRVFRPDHDAFGDHFEKSGLRLNSKSNTGYYSIEALDLNRALLRRLRELRERLDYCERFVAEGVAALRGFHIDQLPRGVKAQAARLIKQMVTLADKLENEIDDVLRDYARSPLDAPDPDGEKRAAERAKILSDLKIMYPGAWRGRQLRDKSDPKKK